MNIDTLEQDPCNTCGYEEGSIYCKEHCPHEAKIEQETVFFPPCQDCNTKMDEIRRAYDKLREPSGDAISRKIISAFLSGLISDETERKKALQYINELPPVNLMLCEDAISRQAVIDSLHSRFADGFDSDRWWNSMSVLYAINKVPPVNPTKTGWIPVSERLPEEYTYTLWCASSRYVRSDYFNGEFWEDAKKLGYEVIAWMPLPKPYEPQEKR